MTLFQRRRAPADSPWTNVTRPDVLLSLAFAGLMLTTPILAVIVLVFDPARLR
jgi:hypothetical protein